MCGAGTLKGSSSWIASVHITPAAGLDSLYTRTSYAGRFLPRMSQAQALFLADASPSCAIPAGVTGDDVLLLCQRQCQYVRM